MTKDEFIKRLGFDNDQDKKDAEHYLDMKGVELHIRAAGFLGYDMRDSQAMVDWSRLASLVRYDKRLRDKLYIFFATLEEYMRAYICNNYTDRIGDIKWVHEIDCKLKCDCEYNLFDILEGQSCDRCKGKSITLGTLIRQVMQAQCLQAIFDCDTKELKDNLKAVGTLRNLISHHVFIVGCDRLPSCIVNNIKCNLLQHNILNLQQLLPSAYRAGFAENINKAAYEHNRYTNCNATLDEYNRHTNRKTKLDEQYIIDIGVIPQVRVI